MYSLDDVNALYEIVFETLQKPCFDIMREAYYTIANEWNSRIAAHRFLAISDLLLKGKNPFIFESGICSKAEVLENNWYEKDN